jgi:hypothetical protein
MLELCSNFQIEAIGDPADGATHHRESGYERTFGRVVLPGGMQNYWNQNSRGYDSCNDFEMGVTGKRRLGVKLGGERARGVRVSAMERRFVR